MKNETFHCGFGESILILSLLNKTSEIFSLIYVKIYYKTLRYKKI